MAESYYQGAYTGAEIDAAIGKVGGIEAGAEVNVQADWTQADNTKDDFIKNKPTLGTAAAKGVDSAPTASSTNLVESGGVKSALAGKQATLTTAQQAAADSGITAAKVGQYDKDSAALPSAVDGGAKNLLKSEAQSTTAGGVEFTVNSDGTYTLNGTATTSTWFVLSEGNNIKAGSYVLTSGVEDLGINVIAIIAPSKSLNDAIMRSDTIQTATFTTDQTGMLFAIRVQNGASLSNVVVKPMLCTKSAWDVSQKYVSYCPSMAELYAMIQALQQA